MTRLILSVLALFGFMAFVSNSTWEERARSLLPLVLVALITIQQSDEARARRQSDVVEPPPGEQGARQTRRLIYGIAAVSILALLIAANMGGE